MNTLEWNRRATESFIRLFPLEIVLVPHVRVQTASGGYELQAQSPRAVQTMTWVENPNQDGLATPERTVAGEVRKSEHMLLGKWDAQMAVGDTFVLDGKTWEIKALYFENRWERRARVAVIRG